MDLTTVFGNWRTTLVGFATIMCAGTSYFELVPVPIAQGLNVLCMVLIGLGLIVSADGKHVAPKLALFFVCLAFAGCTTAEQAKVSTVLVQLKADTHTVIIHGCTALPSIEVALEVAQEFIPPSPPELAAVGILKLTDDAARALCAKVQAMPAAP